MSVVFRKGVEIDQIREAVNNGDLDYFPQGSEILKDLINKKINVLDNQLLLVKIYDETMQYEYALELINEVLSQEDLNQDRINHFRFKVYEASIYQKIDRIQYAEDSIIECFEIYSNFNNQEQEQIQKSYALLKHISGVIHWKHGEFNRAMKDYKESLELRKMIGDQKGIAYSYNNIGIIKFSEGNILEALEYYSKSLDICKKINFWNGQGRIYVNQSLVYQRIGDLKNVDLNSYLVIDLAEKHAIITPIKAFAYRNLGLSFYYKNSLHEAMGNLQIALDLFLLTNYHVGISLTLFYLVQVSLTLKQQNLATEYIEKLSSISDEYDLPLTKQAERLAVARKLKESKRLKNKMVALDIVEEVASQQIVHIDLTMFAILTQCELLIQELYYSGNYNLIDTLELTIDNLANLANQQYSEMMHIEAMLLKSQVHIMRLELQEAQKLLLSSQITAKQHGLESLALFASTHLDRLINNYGALEALKAEKDLNVRIHKLLNLTKFSDMLSQMAEQKHFVADGIDKEVPILFLIIDEGGTLLINRKFDSKSNIHEHLFGSLVSALSLLSSEVFSREADVQTIKIDQLTIMIKNQNDLYYCYIFEGNSYYALNRLSQIIFHLEADSSLNGYVSNKWTFFVDDKANTLLNYIDRVFSESYD